MYGSPSNAKYPYLFIRWYLAWYDFIGISENLNFVCCGIQDITRNFSICIVLCQLFTLLPIVALSYAFFKLSKLFFLSLSIVSSEWVSFSLLAALLTVDWWQPTITAISLTEWSGYSFVICSSRFLSGCGTSLFARTYNRIRALFYTRI